MQSKKLQTSTQRYAQVTGCVPQILNRIPVSEDTDKAMLARDQVSSEFACASRRCLIDSSGYCTTSEVIKMLV